MDDRYNAKQGPKGEQIFWLPFEDFKVNTREWLVKLAAFLEVPVTDEVIDKVLQGSDFANMKTKTAAKGGSSKEATSRFNKGTSGGWSKQFTREQSQAMDKLIHDRITTQTNVSFDFGIDPYAEA